MNHSHHNHCEHQVKYCQQCDVCYCEKCGIEWKANKYTYYYPNNLPGQTTWTYDWIGSSPETISSKTRWTMEEADAAFSGKIHNH